LALVALVLMLGSVSGAHLNPAITLGLWSLRRIKPLPAVAYIGAQLSGAIAGYYLYTYFVNSQWEGTGAFEARVLVAEAAGALLFAMGWASVVYQKYTGGTAAFVIGASFALGLLVASIASVATGVFSGGFINPALALGAQQWVWGSYMLGPVLGAVIGFNLYALLFAPASELAEETEKSTTRKK
jgi:glycerol uptake facilitator protein